MSAWVLDSELSTCSVYLKAFYNYNYIATCVACLQLCTFIHANVCIESEILAYSKTKHAPPFCQHAHNF